MDVFYNFLSDLVCNIMMVVYFNYIYVGLSMWLWEKIYDNESVYEYWLCMYFCII